MNRPQDYLREIITIFFIRKTIISFVFMVIASIAVLVALLWPSTYQAQSSVLVKTDPDIISSTALSQDRADVTITENSLFTEMQVFESEDLAEAVVKSLMASGTVFSPDLAGPDYLKAVSKVKTGISTLISPKSNVFNVMFDWRDRHESELILAVIMRSYLDFRNQLYNPTQAVTFFQRQLSDINNKLQGVEQQLIVQTQQIGSPDPDVLLSNNLSLNNNLTQKLQDVALERVSLENHIQLIERKLSEPGFYLFSTIRNPAVEAFAKHLQDLLFNKVQNLEIYTPQSMKMQRKETMINVAYENLKKEIRGYVEDKKSELLALKQSESQIREIIARNSDKNMTLYEDNVSRKALMREQQLLEEAFSTYYRRHEAAKIKDQAEVDSVFSVTILSKPFAQEAPVFPNPLKVIPLGVIFALISGISVGFVVEFFDHTLKRPEDVENYLNRITICTIPVMN